MRDIHPILKKPIILALSFCCVIIFACKQKNEPTKKEQPKAATATQVDESFSKILGALFTDSLATDTLGIENGMRAAYTKIAFAPIWINRKNDFAAAESFLTDISKLSDDGIATNRYHIADMRSRLTSVRANKTISIDSLIAFDTVFTKAYVTAAHNLQYGIISPALVDDEWLHDNDTAWFVADVLALATQEDKYLSLDTFRSKLEVYQLLSHKRKEYLDDILTQKAKYALGVMKTKPNRADVLKYTGDNLLLELHPDVLGSKDRLMTLLANSFTVDISSDSNLTHLKYQTDSLVAKIDVNLERLRWLPQRFEDKYVIVTIPLMELYIRDGAKDTMHMRVVIGKKSRATPSMNADMVNIVMNPTWTVPSGIMKKDVIPGMNKKGSAYLDKKGLAVYNHQGKKLNPDSISITSTNFKRYIFRQPSGYRNALGRVKFNLPNKENIYLHDTPSKYDFKKNKRDKSSGCVRVQHPRDMATYIFTGINGIDGRQLVDSLLRKNKMVFVPLKQRLPVHLVYITVTEDSTKQNIQFLDDVYNKDEAVAKLLN